MQCYYFIVNCSGPAGLRGNNFQFSANDDQQAEQIARLYKKRVLRKNRNPKLKYDFALSKMVCILEEPQVQNNNSADYIVDALNYE